MADSNSDRAVAFSQQLRRAHQQLSDQLGRIRAGLGRDERARAGLDMHCLAFCTALARHHAGEDDGMFTDVLQARPDLAPAIGKLTDDHAAIAAILRQIRALAASDLTLAADLPGLRRELDGLAAIAESHFRYEERALSAALDRDLTGRDMTGRDATGRDATGRDATGRSAAAWRQAVWRQAVFSPAGPQRPLP